MTAVQYCDKTENVCTVCQAKPSSKLHKFTKSHSSPLKIFADLERK